MAASASLPLAGLSEAQRQNEGIPLIERLMMRVEHVLVANQLTVVTKEVVETAHKNLIIGLN